MQTFDFRRLLPHLYIVLGFALFALLFSYPALQGKVLSQGDVINWKAMYHETETYHDSTGINALWTNSMFGGMPNYTIGIPESNNYLGYIQTGIQSILVKPAYFIFLALLGFYILMQVMRIDRWVSIVGSLAYAFATYNIILIIAGHDTKMIAIAYLPAVLAGLIMIYNGRWLGGSAVLGVSLVLMASSLHYQVLYYALFVFLFYVVGRFFITIRNKGNLAHFFIASAIALVVSALAVGTIMGSLLTTREYAKTTMRGGESEMTIGHDAGKKTGGLDKDYAFAWSNGIGETFCLIVPYLYGGSSSEPIEKAPESEALVGGQAASLPLYWGPQPFLSGPVYFGAVVCFLFVLGLMVVRSPYKWWIAALCALTIMMSWGKHFPAFNYFLFDHLPMYNKFRIPSMILIVPQLLFPLLGVWGLMEIVRGNIQGEELWKKIKLAAIPTAGLCILLAFGASAFFEFSNPATDSRLPEQLIGAIKSDRASLAQKSAFTSAVYILLAAGLLWAFAKSKVNKTILIGGIGLLIAIDLLSVASNYLGEDNYQDATDYEALFQQRPVDQQILRDPDPYYRVLDVTRDVYNDATQVYWHKSVGGYSPAKMEIYQDLIDIHLGGVQSGGKFNASVLNMLNTKYIIAGQAGQEGVIPNPDAAGNAWFVNEVKEVKTADEEIMSLKGNALGDTVQNQNAFDPKKTAVIRTEFAKQLQGYGFEKNSAASIALTKYGLNDLSYTSSNSKNGLAVFSDIWYPYGWEASVDGKPVKILRADYVLRAIKVPAGNHTIEFHFRPKSFNTGNTIAMISSLLLIGLIAAALVQLFRAKRNHETDSVVRNKS